MSAAAASAAAPPERHREHEDSATNSPKRRAVLLALVRREVEVRRRLVPAVKIAGGVTRWNLLERREQTIAVQVYGVHFLCYR